MADKNESRLDNIRRIYGLHGRKFYDTLVSSDDLLWLVGQAEKHQATPPADAALGDALPEYEDCVEAIRCGNATALHRFIASQEPAGRLDAGDFREGLSTVVREAAALRARAVPEGFVPANVRNLDVLVAAIERASSKGYLPDAIADAWEEFDYAMLAASQSGGA